MDQWTDALEQFFGLKICYYKWNKTFLLKKAKAEQEKSPKAKFQQEKVPKANFEWEFEFSILSGPTKWIP